MEHETQPFSDDAHVSRWNSAKKIAKKILYWTLSLLLLSIAVFLYFRYFHTYSEGSMEGLLYKFAHKGTIFKTYEGELILISGSVKNDAVIASEKFYFSVTDENLAQRLDTLQGMTVMVRYKQKYAPLMWKGDTRYYVDSVRVRK